ncbi:MAG: hypothetical protein K8F91_17490 [Candidatus Obscuribacterales bacterium]|nr:hypothetical protein [Candidatus Obscuribacterales bacterium]
MTSSGDHNIDGQWRGFYAYRNRPDDGSGFDAHFESVAGALTGAIHDDQGLGEALISGSFDFPSINFTKVYVSGTALPIHYVGTMSDDGKSLSGTWLIAHDHIRVTGTWRAHRIDEEYKKSRAKKTSTVKVKERKLESQDQ